MGIKRAKIEAAFAEFWRMNDTGDYSGFADRFAEDATFVNSALPEPIQGRNALRRYVEQWPKVVNRPEWHAIDENRLVVGWNERQESMRADAPPYRGFSTFVFNDDGLVTSYEGMFNMVAVAEATAP